MYKVYFKFVAVIMCAFFNLTIYANVLGSKPNIARDSFSGKVHFLAIGINKFDRKSGYNYLSSAESDVLNFKMRLKNESKIKEISEYIYLSNNPKKAIIDGIKKIEQTSNPHDILIVYGATYGNKEGALILSDGSTISSTEFYLATRNILCLNQLFFLDMMNGDMYINNLKKYLISKPFESKITNSNVVILSVNGLALETKEGGYFTLSYTKSKNINIFDLFSTSDRVLTDFKKKFYNYTDTMHSPARFEISFFSESMEIEKIISNTKKDSILTRKSIPIGGNGSPNSEFTIKKGETLAFIFGCKDFINLKKLYNSVEDAEIVKRVLESKYISKVIYLENPTHKEFYSQLAKIQNEYIFESGSQFLFFAATHGIKNSVNEGHIALNDTKEVDGTVINGVSLSTLNKVIAQLKCSKSLTLIDACYSISAFEKECTAPNPIPIPENSPIFKSFKILSNNYLSEKTNLFFGSSHDQEAADGFYSNSPFTKTVVNFLVNNPNKISDSYYLEKHISENVMKEGSISLPLFCSYGGRSDGRFFFFQKGSLVYE
jgi:hypothetical protein